TLDYPGRSEWQNIWFTKAWSQEGYYRIGDARDRMNDQCVPYASSDTWVKWCMFEYNLYGDPTLEMWTDVPKTLVVDHPSTVSGATNFTVTVYESDGTTPVESAYVCLWCKIEDTVYVRGYTDANGSVTLFVSPSVNGDTMWVTVTKHNYLPYEGFAVVNLGCPSTPVLVSLFDNAKVSTLTPTLEFVSTDPQGDGIRYKIYWDTLSTFATVDSETTVTIFASGDTGNYTFSSNLLHGKTYYWKVRAKDPTGSNLWSEVSSTRSFTVDTTLPAGTCSWFQHKAPQWEKDSLISVVIQGDSLVLPGGTTGGTNILINENFEGTVTGWTYWDGDGDGYSWYIAATGQSDLGGYDPPNPGSYYAYYSDDDAGSGNTTANEWLYAPQQYVGGVDSLFLSYGWGLNVYVAETLYTVVRVHDGTQWSSSWYAVAVYASDGSGYATHNLTSFLPAESIRVAWVYRDGGNWGWACAVDSVLLIAKTVGGSSSGTLITLPISFQELSQIDGRTSWGEIIWTKANAQDSISIQVEYLSSGVWNLVPDADLPGNSSGFFTTSPGGTLSIDALDPAIYDTLRIKANFYATSTKATSQPSLLSLEVGRLSSALSLELVNFQVLSTVRGVLVKWKMAQEHGVKKYTVYRSEGKEKIPVFSVGASPSTASHEYSYFDTHVKAGKRYTYWLAVGTSSGTKWYGPKSVIAMKKLVFGLSLPKGNLANKGALVEYTIPEKSDVSLSLYTVSGRRIKTLVKGRKEAGIYKIRINTEEIPPGLYFLMLTAGDKKAVKKLIITR
ncbi:hypothetical protein DRQ20_04550, partial [bacterium]